MTEAGLTARAVDAPSAGIFASVQFVAVSVQLLMILVLLRLYDVEPGSGVSLILPIIFFGFLIHAALPLRFRTRFFLALSVVAIGVVLGPRPAAVLIVVGLTLIGISHLPVAFWLRVLLLALFGAALAALRSGWGTNLVANLPQIGTPRNVVLPVLGSMFMFRLAIYLYDLRYEESASGQRAAQTQRGVVPATVWTRLSYFFLLPNVCFLLFPVVDYRTYRRTYYDSEPIRIYQNGVQWMCIGLVYLLLYRVVYHYIAISPGEIGGLGGVVRFMVASYLVYFRVVGQFHLITGILCLFGFNLPPAHRFFLLASGFTDFWRRARIDWKDFMVKVVYFPALVPLQRKWGATVGLVVGTVAVFITTWLLHAIQWFWLRGDFRLSLPDAVFWGVFGTCVLINSLIESRGPRKSRAVAGTNMSVISAAVRVAKIMGMFGFLCIMWSYWSSRSPSDWLDYISQARESGFREYAAAVLILGLILCAGTCVQLFASRISRSRAESFRSMNARTTSARASQSPVGWRAAAVTSVAVALILVVVSASKNFLGAASADIASTLLTNHLNAADQEQQDRGYYERLLDEPRSIAFGLTDARFGVPKVAVSARASETVDDNRPEKLGALVDSKAVRHTKDILEYELLPSYSGSMRNQPFSTNSWGMRDKEYSLRPARGTYRIALLGSSYEMASGVRQTDGFESILEDSLNTLVTSARRFEILNFSVGGYAPLQDVIVADRKVSAFNANAVMYAVHSNEEATTINHLVWMVRHGIAIPYPDVSRMVMRTGVRPDMADLTLRHRLAPIAGDVVRWSYHRIAELCRQRGVPMIALVIPRTDETKAGEERRSQYISWARHEGFTILSAEGAYGMLPLDTVSISAADRHPNVLGHRLLAASLSRQLIEDHALSGLHGFPGLR